MLSFYTGTARATVDVDFIIGGGHFDRAAKAVEANYSELRYNNKTFHVTYDTTRNVKDPERIDLVHGTQPLFREVVSNHSVTIRDAGHVIKLPSYEAAMALKYGAIVSPNRGDKRNIDAYDLERLAKARKTSDERTLSKLGNLVFPGGGDELVDAIADMRLGKPVRL
ncbi:nucleotidyl transferase AbiEii/AbiGii toxin family protein [Microbulbifer epialgicus]|uniref:Nucleotidyl transferase AbiEii/AbiGii toxin family protein n=1 Tax=Microbulbifer epialgicus TaxID=393907 RepID=A0ABV4P4B3_9GAMM